LRNPSTAVGESDGFRKGSTHPTNYCVHASKAASKTAAFDDCAYQ
jgi:hypothetical protein